MNTEQPETLAAILAEMRGNEFDDPHLDADGIIGARKLARDWADRIEAALSQERSARATLARLREHLHRDDYTGELYFNTFDYDPIEEVEAALEEPPRNCDRFATAEEAVAAFADHLRAWENAHGIHSECPDHPVQVPAGAFAWLFATSEGGDHV